ncbi:MAG: hypothetical protein MK033_10375 [Candidatus Caenarcaniphilales bacterium]|nr:hypothetical protein [Candidatus Caenarcaniphilales bacterium]
MVGNSLVRIISADRGAIKNLLAIKPRSKNQKSQKINIINEGSENPNLQFSQTSSLYPNSTKNSELIHALHIANINKSNTTDSTKIEDIVKDYRRSKIELNNQTILLNQASEAHLNKINENYHELALEILSDDDSELSKFADRKISELIKAEAERNAVLEISFPKLQTDEEDKLTQIPLEAHKTKEENPNNQVSKLYLNKEDKKNPYWIDFNQEGHFEKSKARLAVLSRKLNEDPIKDPEEEKQTIKLRALLNIAKINAWDNLPEKILLNAIINADHNIQIEDDSIFDIELVKPENLEELEAIRKDKENQQENLNKLVTHVQSLEPQKLENKLDSIQKEFLRVTGLDLYNLPPSLLEISHVSDPSINTPKWLRNPFSRLTHESKNNKEYARLIYQELSNANIKNQERNHIKQSQESSEAANAIKTKHVSSSMKVLSETNHDKENKDDNVNSLTTVLKLHGENSEPEILSYDDNLRDNYIKPIQETLASFQAQQGTASLDKFNQLMDQALDYLEYKKWNENNFVSKEIKSAIDNLDEALIKQLGSPLTINNLIKKCQTGFEAVSTSEATKQLLNKTFKVIDLSFRLNQSKTRNCSSESNLNFDTGYTKLGFIKTFNEQVKKKNISQGVLSLLESINKEIHHETLERVNEQLIEAKAINSDLNKLILNDRFYKLLTRNLSMNSPEPFLSQNISYMIQNLTLSSQAEAKLQKRVADLVRAEHIAKYKDLFFAIEQKQDIETLDLLEELANYLRYKRLSPTELNVDNKNILPDVNIESKTRAICNTRNPKTRNHIKDSKTNNSIAAYINNNQNLVIKTFSFTEGDAKRFAQILMKLSEEVQLSPLTGKNLPNPGKFKLDFILPLDSTLRNSGYEENNFTKNIKKYREVFGAEYIAGRINNKIESGELLDDEEIQYLSNDKFDQALEYLKSLVEEEKSKEGQYHKILTKIETVYSDLQIAVMDPAKTNNEASKQTKYTKNTKKSPHKTKKKKSLFEELKSNTNITQTKKTEKQTNPNKTSDRTIKIKPQTNNPEKTKEIVTAITEKINKINSKS